MIAHDRQTDPKLASLYLEDETAWLEAMSGLVREGRVDELDLPNLAECLHDMALSQRREVESRIVVLLIHLLKWEFQPARWSRSWLDTLIEQQQALIDEASRGVLLNHGVERLPASYGKAVRRAAAQTGLPVSRFPKECPYTFDQLLEVELPETAP